MGESESGSDSDDLLLDDEATISFQKQRLDAFLNRDSTAVPAPLVQETAESILDAVIASANRGATTQEFDEYAKTEYSVFDRWTVSISNCTADANEEGIKGVGVWNASVALVKYLNKAYGGASFWAGKRVLEIGAGVGIPGIALAKVADTSVMLTDFQPRVVELLQHNVDQNSVSRFVKVSESHAIPASLSCTPKSKLLSLSKVVQFDWNEPVPTAIRDFLPAEFILASDVIYGGTNWKSLIAALRDLSGPTTVILLAIGTVQRGTDEHEHFLQQAAEVFTCERMELEDGIPIYKLQHAPAR